MASGTISLGTSGKIKGRITWSSKSNGTAANSSTVTATIQIARTDGYTTTGHWSGFLNVNGSSENFNIHKSVSSGWVTLISKTITKAHNDNGKATCYIGGSISAPSGTSQAGNTVSGNTTVNLDTIPRAASITSAPNFNDEANPVLKYSNPAGSSVDSLEACISLTGSTDDIAYRNISKTGTSYTFNLTAAERNVLRNATSGKSRKVRFYVQTTIGSTVYRDYQEVTFSITNANPTISNIQIYDTNNSTIALTGDKNILVRHLSTATVSCDVAAVKGAKLKTFYVNGKAHTISGSKTAASLVYSGADYTTKDGKYSLQVNDTRGFMYGRTFNNQFVNYTKLTCNVKAGSATADGKFSFTISGNFYNGSFGAVDNDLKLYYRWDVVGGTFDNLVEVTPTINGNSYSAEVVLEGLDYTQTYQVVAMASDKPTVVNAEDLVVNFLPVFDWGKEDFNFNVNVSMRNNTRIFGTTTDGQQLNAFQPANQNNNCVIGYGGYDNEIGSTNLYGNSVNITSKGSIKANGKLIGENKVLWSGKYYMTEGQTATLSEPISEQLTGIVLIFSRYDIANSTELNEHFSSHFVPKQLVALQEGKGNIFPLSTSNETFAASKYLYISDDSISGHANNDATGTGNNGITYNNNRFVLRYVIGV